MKVFTISSDYNFGANTYLIESGGEYAIVDPGASIERVKSKHNFDLNKLKYIILTHAHFDHILFIDDWANKTNAEVYASKNGAVALRDSSKNLYLQFLRLDNGYYGRVSTVSNGDTLMLGETALKIYSSPGHTECSIIISAENALFVGDTAFEGDSVSRYDLPGGNLEKLKESVEKIRSFPAGTIVYPGHGPETESSKIKRL